MGSETESMGSQRVWGHSREYGVSVKTITDRCSIFTLTPNLYSQTFIFTLTPNLSDPKPFTDPKPFYCVFPDVVTGVDGLIRIVPKNLDAIPINPA